MTMAELRMRNVVKRYGAATVIHGVDLDIDDGEFVVFVGPSGCGKSTLLRMISGLEDVSDGELVIGGRRVNDVSAAERGLAMVFQSYALYPHMTVYQNMAFGLENIGTPRAQIEAKVQAAARLLQLDPLLQRRPTQLSGGQRQRVAIGRAIVREPSIFLFDEPLSNLDAELRVQMRTEITALHRRLGTTMIYVTHDQVEAMTMADKIVVLRGGRIEQVGAPLELYNAPANRFVAGFIGSPRMNFLPARVVRAGADESRVALGEALSIEAVLPVRGEEIAAGESVSVGVRPEHLVLGPGNAGDIAFDATIDQLEQLGAACLVYCSLPGGEKITVQAPGQLRHQVGETVRVTLPASEAHVFRQTEGERSLPRSVGKR
jgi:ABC-type sugar transport system ATPase subunit